MLVNDLSIVSDIYTKNNINIIFKFIKKLSFLINIKKSVTYIPDQIMDTLSLLPLPYSNPVDIYFNSI